MPALAPSSPFPSDGYRLIEPIMLSFLWYQAAELALHHFDIQASRDITNAQRVDCVMRLGALYAEHSDVLSEEADLVMDRLIAAAVDRF